MKTEGGRFPWSLVMSGLAIYLLLQAMFVGLPKIAGSSEAREAQVIDIIVRDSSWVLPLRNGIIPSKPPLYHWLGASLSLAIREVSEFSARYTSQLCATLCLFLVSLIAHRFAQHIRTFESPRHPRRAALLAPVILSLTYGFYQMSCQAMVDMAFVACVWSALASVVLCARVGSDVPRQVSELGRTLFWLFCSVGVLARGPLGVVLPVALVGMAGLCACGFAQTVKLFMRPSFGWLAVSIPVTWYYLAYQIGGEPFLERQLFFENIKRFSGGDFVNSEPWWFYIPSLARTTLPWGVLLVAIFFSDILGRKTLSYPASPNRVRWLPLILLCTGGVLFSLSSGKRHSYMLPLLPCVALQLAIELSSLFERGGDRARERAYRVGRFTEIALTGLAMLLLFGVGVFGEFFLASPGYLHDAYQALPVVLARLGVLITGSALITFIGLRRSLLTLYCSLWCLMLVVMTGTVAAGASIKAYLKGFDHMGISWLATASERDQLVVFKHPFDEYFDPILYYLHRPAQILPLEAVGSECRPNTVYAAKRAWLEPHQGLFPGEIVRVLTVRERLLTHRNDESRDIVFFRCGRFASPSPKFDHHLMRDAVYSE